MTINNNLPEKLGLAVNNLAEKIRFLEPINNYQVALELFSEDNTAHKIMEDLSVFQKEIRQKQYDNQMTQQDLEKFRSLQVKAQENEVISSYAQSQQDAIGQLREINAGISNLLGIDFASLAKKSGGC